MSVYQSQDIDPCHIEGNEKITASGNLDVEDSNGKNSGDNHITSQYYVLELPEDSTLVGATEISHSSDVGHTNANTCLESLDIEDFGCKSVFQLELDHNYVLSNTNESMLLGDLQGIYQPASTQITNVKKKNHNCSQKPYVVKFVPGPAKLRLAKIKWKLCKDMKKIYYCEDCHTYFRNEAVLLTHLRFHSGVAPFSCRFCEKGFLLSSSLIQHLKICNSGKCKINILPLIKGDDSLYACPLCENKYKIKSSLKDHLRQHMGQRRAKFKCHVCEDKFLKKSDIMEHMKSHEESDLILCPYRPCNRKFLNIKDLQDHQISHLDERPFVCETCGLTYKRQSHLRRHMLSHANGKKAPRSYNRRLPGEEFVCDICGKVSSTSRLHKLHSTVHTGERNFECPVCNKRFVQSGAVTRHIRTVHRGARDFSCNICQKSFTAKATLESHIRIHTGEKPYQCTVCGKTFRTQQLHRLHEKIHSDERPFVCKYCPKAFRRRPHLVVHTRTHTGEKPYICPTCGHGFAQKNDMLKHSNIHLKNC